MIEGWKYYNYAVIPTTAPHEEADISCIKSRTFWIKCGGTIPLFARWTSDFDCGYETEWWYTIIDKPFNIMMLKSDYRRRIRVGLRNFSCRIIDSNTYAYEMARITKTDWETYPSKYRPDTSIIELQKKYQDNKSIVWGAFDNEGELSAFQIIDDYNSYFSLGQGKSNPNKQKYQVNAALIASYLNYYAEDIKKGKYISNGTRNIIHETNFNEDLCKKYGFRKAYCKLNIKYRFPIGIFVRILFPLRKKINNETKIGNLILSVLKMEEICRKDR